MPAGVIAGSELRNATLFLRAVIASGANLNGSVVFTSFPEVSGTVAYPFITIDCQGISSRPMGISTESDEKTMRFRVQSWAVNVSDRDTYMDRALFALRDQQLSGAVSTIVGGSMHDLRVLSSVTVDDPGIRGVHRRISDVQYKVYS